MRRLRVFLLLAAMCAAAAPAMAQIDQGRFTGTVTDAQGGVLPGVTVTAKSPSLMGVRTTVTEGDGKYSIASLPSGPYELTFELSGFQAFKRAGVILAIGQILTIDGQLQVASLQESVTVTGSSPVVDMQSSKVGTDFTTDKLVGVPTATDVWAVLGQASGVRMNGFDVGGSHKSQQTGYESFGIRNQNRVLNDGVDTTEGTGGAGFYADFFSNEEVAVSAAGGDVEMNSPGSAVVNTIKSGGNTFKMLNNLTYQQESFVGDNNSAELTRAATPASRTSSSGRATPTSAARSRPTSSGSSSPTTTSRSTSRSRACRAAIATDLGVFDNFVTKETWKVSQKDTVVGYYQWGRKQKPNRGLSTTRLAGGGAAAGQRLLGLQGAALARLDQSPVHRRQGQPLRLRLPARRQGRLQGATASLRHRHELHERRRVERVRPGPAEAARHRAVDLLRAGRDGEPRPEGRLRVPARYRQVRHRRTLGADPVPRSERQRERDPVRRCRRAIQHLGDSWRGSNDRDQRYSGYAQDRWNPNNRPTITAGLRWDYQRPLLSWTASAIRSSRTC